MFKAMRKSPYSRFAMPNVRLMRIAGLCEFATENIHLHAIMYSEHILWHYHSPLLCSVRFTDAHTNGKIHAHRRTHYHNRSQETYSDVLLGRFFSLTLNCVVHDLCFDKKHSQRISTARIYGNLAVSIDQDKKKLEHERDGLFCVCHSAVLCDVISDIWFFFPFLVFIIRFFSLFHPNDAS